MHVEGWRGRREGGSDGGRKGGREDREGGGDVEKERTCLRWRMEFIFGVHRLVAFMGS